MFSQKKRFIHTLPGRIRIEVTGLKHNPYLIQKFTDYLSPLGGILKIYTSSYTGNVLLYFDEHELTEDQILRKIESFEISVFNKCSKPEALAAIMDNLQECTENPLPLQKTLPHPASNLLEVAASEETPSNSINYSNAMPFPLALTAGGLGILGVKQLISGKSALARSPSAFQMAALVSVVSGYPKLKQGLSQRSPKRWNLDFLLGASALALALARENLVVLAGLCLLEGVKWRKSQVFKGRERQLQTPEIKDYSEKVGKMNFWIAGAAWVITQNPYIGLAVLLAGNPRIATIPSEYAWNQAELAARQYGYVIPEHSSLPEMARLKTVVFEDTSIVIDQASSEIHWGGSPENETEGYHLAASLMKRTKHPWFEEVLAKASQMGSVRTAYKPKTSDQGVEATVQRTQILMGSLKFLQQNEVDCDPYLIEVKRALRHGFEVECIAKNKIFLGYIKKLQGQINTSYKETLSELHKSNVQLGYLKNSVCLNPELLSDLHLENFQREDLPEQSALARQKRQGFVVITSNEKTPLDENLASLPTTTFDQFSNFLNTTRYAQRIDAHIQQNFRLAKVWNTLGITLGVANALTAPIINLIGDSLSLLFMARSKRYAEKVLANPLLSIRSADKKVVSIKNHPLSQDNSLMRFSLGLPENEHWHNMSPSDLLDRFEVTELEGLTLEKVVSLQKQYGLNQLESKKPPSWLESYLGQFKEFTTLVVLGTTLLAFLSGDVFDGLAMGSILLINAGVGTAQERKAEKVIEALNEYQPPQCKVLRDASTFEIDGSNLVPGDIVILEAGDRVPSDLRLLQSWNLEVNEAALTGESLPVTKEIQLLASDCPLAERKNMLYMGTDITRGKGVGLVVGTGMKTEIGYLMSLMKEQPKLVTPLHEKVTDVSKKFVKFAALAGGIVFVVGLLRSQPLTQIIGTSITLAASAVPEGLPVTITIALSAGVARMVKKNAMIRKLSALETLGRTTVICTDKTGTLTKNEMTVKKIATLTGAWEVSGDGYEPLGEVLPSHYNEAAAAQDDVQSDADLQTLATIGVLCNNSQLIQEDGYWKIKGDPTEGALLSLAGKLNLRYEKMNHYQRVHEVPFDSNSGTMSVVCQDHDQDKACFIYCKGSVESILDHCHWVQINGEIHPLTSEHKNFILEQNKQYASEALRVLGFAYCPTEWIDAQSFKLHKELIYVGLTGMMDPPKIQAEQSIREADALGVKTVMITGDHPITAIAIAQKLGFGERANHVLTGNELDQLTDEQLKDRVEDVAIFARVTPEHKLRIVKAYQAHGHIVAMTGDGVNDTPAIKQSNVGIAMGRTGTEVTKATADMVLVKDDFGSILAGVKEGRTIIGNIRKAIGCLLTGNLAEILVSASSVIMGLPMPLVPIQILLMNLLTDTIPAMILAINPGNDDNLSPITKQQDVVDQNLYKKVITRGILLGGASLGLFAVTLSSGVPLPVAQTVAFSTLVVGQLAQTLSWRKEGTSKYKSALKDRYLLAGLGGSFLALLGTLYIPSLSRFFRTAPIGVSHWIAIFLIASLISLVSKPFLKWMTRNTPLGSGKAQNLVQGRQSFLVA